MSGTEKASPNGTAPLDLPAPSALSLESSGELDGYLACVATYVLARLGAELVGIYLVDPATSRLNLHAWAAPSGESVVGKAPIPADLGRRGIEGDPLRGSTLRDFIHAAPSGERVAAPIHDGRQWFGAIVGLSSRPFSADVPELFHDVATKLSAVLEQTRTPIGGLQIEESEASLDLPSEAIFGHTAGDGVAIGPAIRIHSNVDRLSGGAKIEEDRTQALERLDAAVAETGRQIESLLSDAKSELYDVVSLIFSTHLLMLSDTAFSGAIRNLVQAGQTPEDAVQSVVASFVRTFRGLREARLAEKAQDVRDIGRRLLANLSGASQFDAEVAGHIAVVPDALPSDLIRLAIGHASGVVMLGSAVTAHIAILAQSLGLPIIMTSDRRVLEIATGTLLLLDAHEGKLLISPDAEQLGEYGFDEPPAGAVERLAVPIPGAHLHTDRGSTASATAVPTMESTAERVRVFTNVNLLSDARRGAAMGADGIGLYRSEFPFIIRNDYVSEDEQHEVYRTIVQAMPGKPVLLRTADIGGDKLLSGREEERNPFLGVRGIRFSLANRELFRDQLRAMLRAGHGADLHIMFPMVSSVEEIRDGREEVERCIDELRRSGRPHHAAPKIGAMVELPAAVVTIEEFAQETDFLSIGTNDLTMYLLAVDRTNERLSELYRSHHPVVLRTIADIARRVGDRISDVSVCGEAAADPLMIPFFTGVGITKLSVAPRHIRRVRSTLDLYQPHTASSFSQELLSIRTLREMDVYLTSYAPPEPLITAAN